MLGLDVVSFKVRNLGSSSLKFNSANRALPLDSSGSGHHTFMGVSLVESHSKFDFRALTLSPPTIGTNRRRNQIFRVTFFTRVKFTSPLGSLKAFVLKSRESLNRFFLGPRFKGSFRALGG